MALREVLARFGIQIDGAEKLDQTHASVSGLAVGLAAMGPTLDRMIRATGEFVQNTIHMGDRLFDASLATGLSTDNLQRWRHQAGRANVEIGSLERSLARLQRAAVTSTEGNNVYTRSFRQMGVSVRDADGNFKGVNALMMETADAFHEMGAGAERTALSQHLFGRAGQRMITILEGGSEAIGAINARFDELGGGLSQEVIENSHAAADALDDFGIATDSLRSRVSANLLPALTEIVGATNKVFSWFFRLTDQSALFEAILGTLATAAAYFGAILLRSVMPQLMRAAVAAAPWVALVLIIDDLIVLFRGGRSVIGAFIDELFGPGTAAQWIQDTKEAFEGILLLIREIQRTGLIDALIGDDVRASGRADSVENGQARAFRSAALNGRLTVAQGEDPQVALLRANAIRSAEGLGNLDVATPGVGAAISAPAGGRGRVQTNNVTIESPITIQYDAGAPSADMIQQMNQALDQRNRAAAAGLGQAAGTED